MTMPPYKAPELPDGWTVSNWVGGHQTGAIDVDRTHVMRDHHCRHMRIVPPGCLPCVIPDAVVHYLYPEDHRRAYDATARADELAHRCQLALLEKAERDDRIAEADALLEAAAVLVLQLAPEPRDAFAEALAEYGAKWTGENTDEDR